MIFVYLYFRNYITTTFLRVFLKKTFYFFHFQSTNGVYVNGIKIQPNTNAEIKHCDRIRLDPEGNYDWRFEIQKENPTPAEEPSQQM